MLEPGTTLHRGYAIDRVLGKGGMGIVYLAHQTALGNRRVALKEIIIPELDPAIRAELIAQFKREAAILGAIEHPNLVDVKDCFEENGAHFMVMAFIDGETLEQVLNRLGHPLPVDTALNWADQLCGVLTALHENAPPVIVRDLKPANVMVEPSGRIRLIDFGIAREARPDGTKTSTLLKGAGSVGFAPLEQFGGEGTDARSDIYALGATLYTLLTRTIPPWSMHLATGEATLRPPSAINPLVPPVVDDLVMRMMALRRDQRFASARDARAALAHVGAVLRGHLPHPGAQSQPSPPAEAQARAAFPGASQPSHPASSQPASTAAPLSPPSPATPPTRMGQLVGGLIAVGLAAVVALQTPLGKKLTTLSPSSWMARPAASTAPTPTSPPSSDATGLPGAPPPPEPKTALRACEENLATLGNAMTRYSNEHGGRLPQSLQDLTPHYLARLPTCPAASEQPYSLSSNAAPAAYTVTCEGWSHKDAHIARRLPLLSTASGAPKVIDRDPALDLTPATPEQFFTRGLARYNLGEYEPAREDLQRAVDAVPTWSEAWTMLGAVLSEQKRHSEAVTAYSRAIAIVPSVDAYVGRGLSNNELADYPRALQDFTEADKLHPNDPDVLENVAFTQYKMGSFAEAVNTSNAILSHSLTSSNAYVCRYWCALCVGNGAGAAADAQSFLTHAGWRSYQSPYSVIIGSLGYTLDKHPSEATALLQTGLDRLSHDWPYPCVQHLAGQLDETALLNAATDVEKQTEARCYIGLKAAIEGRTSDARKSLEWVRDNGYKPFFEYRAALAWLARL